MCHKPVVAGLQLETLINIYYMQDENHVGRDDFQFHSFVLKVAIDI